jgi:hypothetical protein
MDTLRKSKSESDRLRSQQMILASAKAKEILDRLISQGDAARLQISTQSQEDDTNA